MKSDDMNEKKREVEIGEGDSCVEEYTSLRLSKRPISYFDNFEQSLVLLRNWQ
jgi:hypothetical protein